MSFPAPGDSSIDTSLDLNHLVKNPPATFFMRVEGEGLLQDGIHPRDLLIVDRSLDALPGKLVVAAVEGELVVRKLGEIDGQLRLVQPETTKEASGEFEIWGVVTTVIHSV